MTSAELALRLEMAPEDPRARAILDAHRIRTNADGIHCACGWSFTLDQLCARDEMRSFAEVIRSHLEPLLGFV